MDKSLSLSPPPPPSPQTDSSASPTRIEGHEAEQPARGCVADLERILLQQQREVEGLQLAAKERLAEAAQQLGAAKRALEDAKMGADWEIDFISKKRVRGGVTEYRVVWTPTWEPERVLMENASKSIEEFEAINVLIPL